MAKIENELKKFKSELKKLSHNELCRQAANFYMQLIASYVTIDELKKKLDEISNVNKPEGDLK